MKDLHAINEEVVNENEIETSVETTLSEKNGNGEEKADKTSEQEIPAVKIKKSQKPKKDGHIDTLVEQSEIRAFSELDAETPIEPLIHEVTTSKLEDFSEVKEDLQIESELSEIPVFETEIAEVENHKAEASTISELVSNVVLKKDDPEIAQPDFMADEIPVPSDVVEKVEDQDSDIEPEDEIETPESKPVDVMTESDAMLSEIEENENVHELDIVSEKEEIVQEILNEDNIQIDENIEASTEESGSVATDVEEVIIESETQKLQAEPEILAEEIEIAKEEDPVTESILDKIEFISEVEDEEDIDEDDIKNYLEHDEEEENEEAEMRTDYSVYSKEELVNFLADKLENAPVQDIKYDVDSIKSNFYKKHKADIDLAKKKFMTDGGDPAEFVFEADPLEEKLKDQLNEYKRLRAEFNKELELEKESNLKKKYGIIDEIKELINGQESINKTFNDFRELQKKWREIGLVPQAEVRNLWENYHHNVEQFYDFIKINRELRDLDLKKNLEQKIKLCEQSEELMMEPSVVKAFKQLQKLHDQWRDIGPVTEEHREDVWERFKSSTTYINKTHQDYFDNLKQDQTNNLNAKLALCEKAEELASLDSDKHKDWEQYSDELIEVQKLWKTIGFATKKENNKIFERFRAACDLFFTKKRDFYFEHKEEQNNNYQMKIELCMQAEALKDSNDWKKTSNELIKLQKDWKEIGPVPRKLSDVIWKRFRAACNEFFDRKEKYFSNIDQEFDNNLKAKEDLIAQVKNFVQLDSIEENINQLKSLQNEWTEIGHVPFKLKDKIQKEFRDAVNEQFDKLKVDSDKRSVLVYKQRLENISQGTKSNRMYRVEKDRIIETIRHLESDIVLLENNIGFFAKTKNAEALIKDVNNKIEKAKLKIKTEKQKLDLINKFE